MTCKIGDGVIVCWSSWGIGTNTYVDPDTGEQDVVYGFVCVENPHDFKPDMESCTPKEIAAHRAALEMWDRDHA